MYGTDLDGVAYGENDTLSRGRRLKRIGAVVMGLLLSLPFTLTDPVFSPVNYLFTPLLVVGRMAVFLGIDWALSFVKKRKSRQAGPEFAG